MFTLYTHNKDYNTTKNRVQNFGFLYKICWNKTGMKSQSCIWFFFHAFCSSCKKKKIVYDFSPKLIQVE